MQKILIDEESQISAPERSLDFSSSLRNFYSVKSYCSDVNVRRPSPLNNWLSLRLVSSSLVELPTTGTGRREHVRAAKCGTKQEIRG